MIEFKHVSKVYQKQSTKLVANDDVNFIIPNGQIFGLIGFSGAGKSTLVRLLAGLEVPTSGEILIDNVNLHELRGKALRQKRQKIGMIFQHFNLLWSRTVIQNVMLPLEIAGVPKAKRTQRALELLELVGLADKTTAYPVELSGGQKQRVGIARALANKPDILISDEATSALDPETTNEILDLLVDINRRLELTILLITHEMHAVAKACQKVAVMQVGKIVERGRVSDVFKHPQQAITKQFVNEEFHDNFNTSDLELAARTDLAKGQIVRLTFHGTQASLPIVSDVIQQFTQLTVNIFQGSIKQTRDGAIGMLDLELIGSDTEVTKVLDYLATKDVESEVLKDDGHHRN
ncbi:methionine ABC transporter ATP-binding protein [Lentilactobacillus senioris]|uniref:methionine ABC transporter ATP-binding protein n=1 Tax=Lentilactobacillus senioris TaxID=931534 RepID=UPI002282E355|nr:methionine ABC transporter ATP-binding protein [Lentilactobacillus senioris]MCY9807277.1 methionine ABC transporter ATP-binding protein [Lentilactobacillus senioris]